MGLSRHTRRYEKLVKDLCAALRNLAPDFTFTSLQVNFGYAAKMHIDKNNLGESCAISLGNFSGGTLWVYAPEIGDSPLVLPVDLAGWSRHTAGDELKGTMVNTHNCFKFFDGRVPHQVAPFSGERYSVIFFTLRKWDASDRKLRR